MQYKVSTIAIFLIIAVALSLTGVYRYEQQHGNTSETLKLPPKIGFDYTYKQQIYDGGDDYHLQVTTNFVVMYTSIISFLNGSTIQQQGLLGNPNKFLINQSNPIFPANTTFNTSLIFSRHYKLPFEISININFDSASIFRGNAYNTKRDYYVNVSYSTNFQRENKVLWLFILQILGSLIFIEIIHFLTKTRVSNYLIDHGLGYLNLQKYYNTRDIPVLLGLLAFAIGIYQPSPISTLYENLWLINVGNLKSDLFIISTIISGIYLNYRFIPLNPNDLHLFWSYNIDRVKYVRSYIFMIIIIISIMAGLLSLMINIFYFPILSGRSINFITFIRLSLYFGELLLIPAILPTLIKIIFQKWEFTAFISFFMCYYLLYFTQLLQFSIEMTLMKIIEQIGIILSINLLIFLLIFRNITTYEVI